MGPPGGWDTHNVGALGLEGVGAAGVEVGAVVALQEAHIVETVSLGGGKQSIKGVTVSGGGTPGCPQHPCPQPGCSCPSGCTQLSYPQGLPRRSGDIKRVSGIETPPHPKNITPLTPNIPPWGTHRRLELHGAGGHGEHGLAGAHVEQPLGLIQRQRQVVRDPPPREALGRVLQLCRVSGGGRHGDIRARPPLAPLLSPPTQALPEAPRPRTKGSLSPEQAVAVPGEHSGLWQDPVSLPRPPPGPAERPH